jgi:hypothetical protein
VTAKSIFRSNSANYLFVAAACYGAIITGSINLQAQTSVNTGANTLQIEVEDGQGASVATSAATPASSRSVAVTLVLDREYRPGDHIVFTGPQRIAIRVDETIPECFVYNPGGAQQKLVYEIPYGRAEAQTGSAYSPQSFSGNSHRITLRTMPKQETKGYRNLALNPCDLLPASDKTPQFYPHAGSNSVSRSLYDFEARNAIDGVTMNGHHGVWPYQSWGPQLRTDIWWKLEFGRLVELDKVRLMIRADFPHDSYWKNLDIEFSDGSMVPLEISSSAAAQEFSFSKRKVSWLRIANVVPEDPAKWCALIELESWGRDLP